MKTNLKRIISLFFTLAVVGILVTSCEKGIIGEEDVPIEEYIIANDEVFESLYDTKTSSLFLSSKNLLTSDELLKSINIEVEVPQKTQKNGSSCSNLYNKYYAWYRAYVKWFYNPTAANEAAMDAAYCSYIGLYNICKGTNYSC